MRFQLVEEARQRGHRFDCYTDGSEETMSRQTLMSVLLAFTIVLLVLAAATLVPSTAPKVSDLGYSTFCPFAPYSTLTLLFFGGLGWMIRQHISKLPE